DPAKDAARRDFTINGLFYDTQTETVIDYVNGRLDLANKVIRAIGDPAARFAEDHLRLLRAVRFAARFEFQIDPATEDAIRAHSTEITKVAAERTRDELTRILTEPHPRRGFELLDTLGLLEPILPEVKAMQGVEQPPEFHPEGDVWTHTMLMLDGLQKPSATLAWGVLLHDIAKPNTYEKTDRIRFNGHAELGAKMAGKILTRLRYPTAVIESVQDLVAQHLKFIEVRKMKESTRKRFLRQTLFAELLELHRLDSESSSRKLENYDFCKAELEKLPPEALRPPRLLTGADLIKMGIPEGPEIGRILRKIEDAQLDGAITTEAQARAIAEAKTNPQPAP
ncbi:MAG: HD domain-containing protein, partial [Saprospiraceae bacterium]